MVYDVWLATTHLRSQGNKMHPLQQRIFHTHSHLPELLKRSPNDIKWVEAVIIPQKHRIVGGATALNNRDDLITGQVLDILPVDLRKYVAYLHVGKDEGQGLVGLVC